MLPFREHEYIPINSKNNYVLAADIGGTNSNFALCSLNKADKIVSLIYSLHIKSRHIEDFTEVVSQVLDHIKKRFGVEPAKACFGVAGVVSENRDRAKPTNLPFTIHIHDIIAKTCVSDAVLINDFTAVAYGYGQLLPDQFISIFEGDPRAKGQKGIIGAGTGLGKSTMYWSSQQERYVPVVSEGGHADFPAQYPEEFKLIEFIREQLGVPGSVSWEDVLSGKGIQHIYSFLGTQNHYNQSKYHSTISDSELNPDQIFALKDIHEQAGDTFKLFARFYARCAKDFALNALTLSGLYIAGGIAANNLDLFELPAFQEEFLNNHKMRHILEQVPVSIIADYNVSLYGAAVYLMLYC